MAFTLSNSHLHFTLDPATSTWSLYTQSAETPAIEGARLNGLFRFDENNLTHLGGLRPWQWRGWLNDADISTRSQPESPHGPLDLIVARVRSGLDALGLTVEFALPQQHPFLLIRIQVRNQGRVPFRVVRLNPIFAGPLHHTGSVRLASPPEPLTFFSNGWQSWSYAGTLTAAQHQPATWLKPFQGPVIHNPLTPLSDYKGQLSSDQFGVLACPAARSAIVAGFLAQREQFGSVDVVAKTDSPSLRLRAQCDDVLLLPDSELVTDWAYVQLIPDYDLDPLRVYAEAVAREHQVDLTGFKDLSGFEGWCSWYHYFNKITEAEFRANLEHIAQEQDRLPLKLVQLDDGFQTQVGDWYTLNDKFPSGLRALSDLARTHQLTPGLWLAPFIATPDSQLVREHPDWFLKNRFGLPANAGFVFNTFARGLDLTLPAVQDHVRQLIDTAVNQWGFPYLKLDFLYAAALPGQRHDPTRTRAQALRTGLQLIRAAAGPETFLLGCGCPLGSAIGLVNALRVGPDVDVRWRPKLKIAWPFHQEPGMPSARNAIRNTLARAPLHRRFWLNDPDCLLVRDTTELSYDQVVALASVIALSGGLFVFSDDLTTLAPERRKLIECLLPNLGQTARAHDWLEQELPEVLELALSGAVGDWKVIGLFNWADHPRDQTIPLVADSHIFDFWNQTYYRATDSLMVPKLSPHSGRLLAVRPVTAEPQFIGSSLHFSQGTEITEWQRTEHGLRFVIALNRVAAGFVTLSLPNRQPLTGERIAPDLYRLPVRVNKQAEITVAW